MYLVFCVFAANMALKRPASQSSTDGRHVASKAVDGSKDAMACSKRELHPWWSVDIGSWHDVSHVTITSDTNVVLGYYRIVCRLLVCAS